MIHLVFFLEERSAKALLEGLIPRIFPPDQFIPRYIPFEGKQDLEKQIVRKMRSWRLPDSYFVVLRDQDAGDCKVIKKRLEELCLQAQHPEALVRVACHELESWYLGDLAAVEQGLILNGIKKHQKSMKFRDPDRLANPSEELEKLTGYVYQKVLGSRALGPLLDIGKQNTSHSFKVFISGLEKNFLNTAN